jgi:1-acyl-sn-glycerol-3-phosphate acyltransferase
MDITVIGSVMPVSFIAKAEVAGWPVLSTLARLQRTVFIDRTRRLQTAAANRRIAERVEGGDVMVLFAEGTTGDGNSILPFRSALLGAAGAVTGSQTITVQPLAVTYVGISGTPVGRADRPHIAWYGDMEFAPHFARLQNLGMVDAVVSFGEPIPFGPDTDRKQLAEACFVEVRRMAAAARQGRLPPNGHATPLFSPAEKRAKASSVSRPMTVATATAKDNGESSS